MRAVLLALTDELRRLRAAGVRTVSVSDESLETLRRLARDAEEGAGSREEGSEAVRDAGGGEPAAGLRPPVSGLREPASRHPPPAAGAGLLPPPPVVTLPAGDKAARWRALRELVLNHPVCRAHVAPGRQVVFGVGSLDASILFVGEAPGADEEEQGEPFVGPAGQLLNRMITAMGLAREDVYIGNIMNWRPELARRADGRQVGNREPTAEEVAFCLPFLLAQIEVVDPRLVVALGATAARGLLGARSFRSLGEVRGRWHEWRGRPLRVTYHPSYLLRKQEEGAAAAKRAKRAAWEDFLAVLERAGMAVSDKQRNYFL